MNADQCVTSAAFAVDTAIEPLLVLYGSSLFSFLDRSVSYIRCFCPLFKTSLNLIPRSRIANINYRKKKKLSRSYLVMIMMMCNSDVASAKGTVPVVSAQGSIPFSYAHVTTIISVRICLRLLA